MAREVVIIFDVEKAWETVIAVVLATAGGLARLLNAKDNSRLKWSMICSELFISGFAGLMILMLARNFGLAGDWLGLISGMAGWIGPRILNNIASQAGKAVGIDVSDTDTKGDG